MSAAPPSLRECFEQLVELAPPQRDVWLATHALDPALRRELLAMLAVDLNEAPLLATSAAALVQQYTPQHEDGSGLIGRSIGPYQLIEVRGQGGTSVVFRAQRASGAGTQTVALKLLRTGLFSVDGQRRFRREQGVLTQLSHPHIAGLIEGGISEAGIPYIAMEFVDGLPITDYANANALGLRARLTLLVTVCRAIDSAHHALVVHRDLKPSNVLVNRDGEIKVLDFGIARLLDDDDNQATQTSAIALTPGYAAPEQYLPGPVTTATDIYALGILLGELLTGQLLPHGHTRFDLSRAYADATTTVPAGLPPAAALTRLMRGDLDAIYNTAHANDPARRYLSAALLADDLERYLRNEPVTARTPSAWYRLRKSMQRNRAVATAAMLALLAIAIGVSLALWQAHAAHEQAQRATAVRDFLVELFDAAKAGQLPDRRLTLEQLVHRASERLQTQTDLSVATRVELLRTLGEVSTAGSDYTEAELLYNQALESARTFYAPTDKVLTHIQLLQASLLIHQSRYADASIAYEKILPQMRKNRDADSVEGLQNYSSALMYSARTEKALGIASEAAQYAAAIYGVGSKGAIQADLVHGNLLVASGHYAEAAPLLESALQSWRDSTRAPTLDFLQGLTDLSRVHQALGQSATAEALLRETLATAERLYDAPHDRIALALLNLGDVLRAQERLDEAESVLTRALAMMQTIYGTGHLRVANALGSVGKLELRRRDLAAAAQHIHTAMEWCERPGLHATRSCIELYADQTELGLASGDLDEADVSSTRALAMAQEIFRDGHHWTAQLWQLRAELSLRRNDAPAALFFCDQARDLLARLGEQQGVVAEAVSARRASALNALGRSAEALVDINQALALWQQLTPAAHLRQIELLDVLASIQARLGDVHSARDTARRAIGLVGNRSQIEPVQLARIEALAAMPHSVQAR
ncbi:serine/threonine protein kinase [Pseudolysobacter antarcticus]|uniref:Serine/threonine protein kinase n=1 Tax=Pseudolysobacter antarcticus TaxID=2511995 RepID=A0A411HJE4_9GAMM|nr:tetratricopeptide repeat protein [Pseudolysobacter antarcticus]QBB70618.1 serine/threonine protein kinase [Pseudolysobacter antarcticus]